MFVVCCFLKKRRFSRVRLISPLNIKLTLLIVDSFKSFLEMRQMVRMYPCQGVQERTESTKVHAGSFLGEEAAGNGRDCHVKLLTLEMPHWSSDGDYNVTYVSRDARSQRNSSLKIRLRLWTIDLKHKNANITSLYLF